MSDTPSSTTIKSLEDMLTTAKILQCYRRSNIRSFIASASQTQLSLSKKLGYSNSTFLAQMIGVHPTRPISEKTARKIEDVFNLNPGSLDVPRPITIEDLYLPDRKKLYPDYTIAREYLLAKRKHIDSDFGKSALMAQASDRRNTETLVSLPGQLEEAILGILDLIDNSGIASKKAFVILRMGIKELKENSSIDPAFIKNLIELSK